MAIPWLKGQTHVHTERSYDGHTPPEEVVRFYQARGYDFLAITDHNRITVVDAPPGMLLIPGVELTQNSTICDPKPVQGYRCLFHSTALFVDPAKDERHGEKLRMPFVPGRREAFQAQFDFAEKLGGIYVLNHPSFHFAADARTIVQLAKHGLKLVELINAGLDQQHPDGREAAERRAEELWDQVLSSGVTVWGLATDDAHHFSDAAERRKIGKFAYTGDRAWIMVHAEKKPAKIREALLAGHFYATTGVLLDEVERSAKALSAVARGSGPFEFVFVGKDGRELSRSRGVSARYEPKGNEGYVRLVVSDTNGHKAWLQPVPLG